MEPLVKNISLTCFRWRRSAAPHTVIMEVEKVMIAVCRNVNGGPRLSGHTVNQPVGTRVGGLASCGAQLTSCKAVLTSCGAELAPCEGELTSCKTEPTFCGAELASCKAELTSCRAELAPCESELSSCGDELADCWSAPSIF